ncbi:MAG: coenzyme F420-0:L-glutamate ligase [Oscillospiraceae bacterium]|nr:coenzyme F420-0:L-glutamate ligase [Oscillospiraceae bacterium]
MKKVGTVSRGICTPIFSQGMDIAKEVADAVITASQAEKFELNDRDVIGVTESILARTQGNYATLKQISDDVSAKLPPDADSVGVTFPIMSRNRFSQILRGIAMACKGKKLYLLLAYPSDEVGNPLISLDVLDEQGVNPYTDTFTAEEFTAKFGDCVHPFTGIDYIKYYKDLGESEGAQTQVILGNDPRDILKYTPNVIVADIHSRHRSKRLLKAAGAGLVTGVDEILNTPPASNKGDKTVHDGGWHPDYGLLGSNLATNDSVKLFPRDAQAFADKLSTILRERTGKNIEVMVYGDGAFKDPVGGIWELADPVVSPGFTEGLRGTPNEVKLKYLADNVGGGEEAIKAAIRSKKADLTGDMAAQGTTPRRLTDLLGSLCDLTSGSGDKGTPVVLVQGYFDSFAD